MISLLPFQWHLGELIVLVALWFVHHALVTSTRDRRRMLAALVTFAAVTFWPIGELAAHTSLTVATVQRLVIMLVVAPLVLLATPTDVLVKLTRPAAVDPVVRRLSHPGVAIFVVTILGTATLSTPVVDWGAQSTLGRDVVLLTVLFVGLVLWVPALAIMPGAKRLSPAARAGYVFGSAIVVTSLSFVWIFSQRPLYPALHDQYALLHMTPVFDQQLAGFVAKLGSYIPMWAVAFQIFFKADEDGANVDDPVLHWADVERQLLRLDRQQARALRRHRPQ
jgi:cytochrome c oxidase assembly factor CtaG